MDPFIGQVIYHITVLKKYISQAKDKGVLEHCKNQLMVLTKYLYYFVEHVQKIDPLHVRWRIIDRLKPVDISIRTHIVNYITNNNDNIFTTILMYLHRAHLVYIELDCTPHTQQILNSVPSEYAKIDFSEYQQYEFGFQM